MGINRTNPQQYIPSAVALGVSSRAPSSIPRIGLTPASCATATSLHPIGPSQREGPHRYSHGQVSKDHGVLREETIKRGADIETACGSVLPSAPAGCAHIRRIGAVEAALPGDLPAMTEGLGRLHIATYRPDAAEPTARFMPHAAPSRSCDQICLDVANMAGEPRSSLQQEIYKRESGFL